MTGVLLSPMGRSAGCVSWGGAAFALCRFALSRLGDGFGCSALAFLGAGLVVAFSARVRRAGGSAAAASFLVRLAGVVACSGSAFALLALLFAAGDALTSACVTLVRLAAALPFSAAGAGLSLAALLVVALLAVVASAVARRDLLAAGAAFSLLAFADLVAFGAAGVASALVALVRVLPFFGECVALSPLPFVAGVLLTLSPKGLAFFTGPGVTALGVSSMNSSTTARFSTET